MVIHVGIDCNNVSAYNTGTKKFLNFKTKAFMLTLYDGRNNVNIIQDSIKLIKIEWHEEFGCICVRNYPEDNNKFRKEVNQVALSHGFKKVHFIEETSLLYITALSQSSYKPINGDTIWIFNGYQLDVWKKLGDKARFIVTHISEQNLAAQKVNMDSLPKPNVVYYDKPVHPNIIMNFDTNILCSCYDLNYYNFATAALIKARIIGNDKEFEELDVEVLFYFQLQIEFKQKVIISVEKFSAIPLKRQATIMADLNNNELTISEEWNIFTVPLPDFKKILVTLTIEENMIYTVKSTIVSYELFETYAFPHIIRSNFDTINAIGIDLGTTRCCAAVNRRNGIGTVALDNQGERLLPSYVAYDEKNVKCGRIVIDRLRDHSKASVFDSKRYIGKKFRDINIDNNCILKLVSTGNMPKNNNTNYYKMKYNEIYFEIESYSGKVLKRPEEVSADLLKRIKEKAEEFQGTNLNEVVITVPAAFTEAQNEATYVAAKLAGWDLIRFLPEPVAAAFGYFIDRSIPNNSTVLLFDLGGGTLDVCIFKIQNNELVIISRSGDPNLGGRDFDNILIRHFRDKMKNLISPEVIEHKKYKLMLKCQDIKETISIREDDSLDVDEFNPDLSEYIFVTRKEFEKMSTPLLSRIKENIKAALKKINFNETKINMVLQVGGCCRMPMIKKLLKEIFPMAKHICVEHPDEVVAIGAAYYAYYLGITRTDGLLKGRDRPPRPPKLMRSLKKFFRSPALHTTK